MRNYDKLFEAYYSDMPFEEEGDSIRSSSDVKELFKHEIFHNSDLYSSEMKSAMSYVIRNLRESCKVHPTDPVVLAALRDLNECIVSMGRLSRRLNEDDDSLNGLQRSITSKATDAYKSMKTILSHAKSPRELGDKGEEMFMSAVKNYFDFFNLDNSKVSLILKKRSSSTIEDSYNGSSNDFIFEIDREIRSDLEEILQQLKSDMTREILKDRKIGKDTKVVSITGEELDPTKLTLDSYYKDYCCNHDLSNSEYHVNFHG